jgi:arsenate reductase-like glutaredoxin family protein
MKEIDALKKLAGSYEALFSRRSQQIRKLGLDLSTFGEKDYRKYLGEHYSFLKRPVAVIDGEIFIGNAKKNVEAAKAAL